MQYLITLSPILIIFISLSTFKKKVDASDSIIKLIEGSEHCPNVSDELYKLADLLIKLRSLYGPKISSSINKLKKEVIEQKRELKKIKGLRVSAYFQQGVMITLISTMIYISSSMFPEIKVPYGKLLFLQLFSIILIYTVEKWLYKKLIAPIVIRYKFLLTITCLSGSSLSVSKVLSYVEWNKLSDTLNKKNRAWDEQFNRTIQEWKTTGRGLDARVVELESDLLFLKEIENKRYKDFVEVTKFLSLIVSGFFSYFLYLFSLLNSFLS